MRPLVIVAVILLAACSATTAVEPSSRSVTGVGGDVRVDAEIAAPARSGDPIEIRYVITNGRPAPISLANLLPQTSFDVGTNTVTVKIGAEAAGAGASLVRLAPGEKRSFSTVARLDSTVVNVGSAAGGTNGTLLRLQLNFVDDGRPESVYTSTIPAYR